MVEPIRNKQAKTILNAFVRIIERECALPTLVYCDNGSEFNNKLFTDARTNRFRVQFTIDRRKVVHAERAIRMIRRALEQYYAGRPNEDTKNYRKIIQKVVKSHNNAPSNPAPKIDKIINASPFEILHDDVLTDEMKKVLKDRTMKQYTTKINF